MTLGLLSGFYPGAVDDAISWFMNVQLSFPFILLDDRGRRRRRASLRTLIVVLGIGSWVAYARVLRGQVLTISRATTSLAARTVGAGEPRLLLRHVLPTRLPTIIVIASFEMARMIVTEASLSFLGLGVEPSVPSGLDARRRPQPTSRSPVARNGPGPGDHARRPQHETSSATGSATSSTQGRPCSNSRAECAPVFGNV